MTRGMKLEDFFLSDYERLRKQVAELEEQVRQLQPHEYGITDLGRRSGVIKVYVTSASYLYNDDTTAEQLDELLKKSDTGLLEWGKQHKVSYGAKAVRIERRTMPYTVRVVDMEGEHLYATNGYSEYVDLSEPEDIEELIGSWCDASLEQLLLNAAVRDLRKELKRAHEAVLKRESED